MRICFLIPFALGLVSPATAHEFWIAPETYSVAIDAPLNSNIRVGQDFEGNAYSYFTRSTERFEVVLGAATFEADATLGDRPALQRSVVGEGLAVVVHETTDSRLTYREWEKFVNFVEHKAFTGALERHAERGLPNEGFVETYRRYAKSLIAVGDGEGSDRAIGLDTEIIALANPYTDDVSDGLPVLVTLYGEPRPNAQVELFTKSGDEDAIVTLFRTNAEGIAMIAVEPGKAHMLDAVVLEERKGDVAWHSMWANLTFMVPDS